MLIFGCDLGGGVDSFLLWSSYSYVSFAHRQRLKSIYVGLEKPKRASDGGRTNAGLILKVLMRQVENCRDKAMHRDMMWKLSKLFVWRIVE